LAAEESLYERFRSGLTLKSVLAALYATVIFIPALIYLELVTGRSGFPVAWFMLLLWVELSALYGRPLTKQEAFLVYMLAGIEFLPLELTYRAWFRNAPIVTKFGLTEELPNWWVPPVGSPIFEQRTLFHPDWLIPIFLMVMWTFLSSIGNIALGFVARELYMEVEELPFPIEEVDAVAVVSLTGEERRPIRILSVFAIAGFLWGSLVYAMPFVLQAWTGQMVQLVPIPWIDMNQQVEGVFPGASFGLATDIIPYTTGLVIPFSVATSMMIGSLAIYFFGNWITVSQGIGPRWWLPGMKIDLAAQQSILYFWAPITIGLTLAAGVGPLLRRPRSLIRAFSSLANPFARRGKRRSDPVPGKAVILTLILSLGGGTAVFMILAPDFVFANLWILPFMVGMPFVTTIIGGRIRGETGVKVKAKELQVEELQKIMYLMSGYPKVDVWFAPNPMTKQGAGWLSTLKVAQLTETKASSAVKAYLLLLPFTVVIGLLYVQLLWRMAPIPSGRYPGAQIFWPIRATYDSLWIRGQQAGMFNVQWIFSSLAVGTGVYFALDFAHGFLPLSYIGIAAGVGQLPPIPMAIFIGGITSKVLARKFGERWRSLSRLVAAGLAMGESIAITVSVALSLIVNSIWILPI